MLRLALTIVYVAVLAVAVVAQFVVPAVSSYVFWGVLIWFVASLFLYRSPAMNRPVHLRRTPRPAPDGTPLPSSPALPGSTDLGFCVHCGTNLTAGSSVCPACGRTVLPV